MGMTSSPRQTHRELPLSVQDGDERLALEDDLAGGETPVCRGGGYLVGGRVESVGLGCFPLHDRRPPRPDGLAHRLPKFDARCLAELFLRPTEL